MKFPSFSIFGIAVLILFMVVTFINKTVQADACCPPPLRPAVAARFQQNAQVTVYLDITSGFNDDEKTAIKAGLEEESRRTDQYGNQFRYRAKVNGVRWAWDVFFVALSTQSRAFRLL